jgi:hypothetical protein
MRRFSFGESEEFSENRYRLRLERGVTVLELVGARGCPAGFRSRPPLTTRQITAGFKAAHEKGIVRRDLKPAHIRVIVDGVEDWISAVPLVLSLRLGACPESHKNPVSLFQSERNDRQTPHACYTDYGRTNY